jgi:hypothetical protein
MGRKSSPPPAPVLPPPPPREELMDVIDEISGSQAITVTGADGKKKRVITRLPLTPQQEEEKRIFQNISSTALENMVRLSQFDPYATVDFLPLTNVLQQVGAERSNQLNEIMNIPDFSSYVNQLRQDGINRINEELGRHEQSTLEGLKMRGYGEGSTALAETRNAFGKARASALKDNEIYALQQGDARMAADMAQRANTYNLGEQGRQARLQEAQTEHALELNKAQQVEQQRQQYLQNNLNLYNIATGQQLQDKTFAINSQAPQLANQIFQQSNADNLARYQAGINAQMGNYQAQMANYNAQPVGFGNAMLGLGMQGLGAFGGAYAGGKGLGMSGVMSNQNNPTAAVNALTVMPKLKIGG